MPAYPFWHRCPHQREFNWHKDDIMKLGEIEKSRIMLNSIRESREGGETRNAWNRFIRSSLLNRSVRSASNRESSTPHRGRTALVFEKRLWRGGGRGAPCDRLWHIRLPAPSGRQRGIIPDLRKDLVKRVDPSPPGRSDLLFRYLADAGRGSEICSRLVSLRA